MTRRSGHAQRSTGRSRRSPRVPSPRSSGSSLGQHGKGAQEEVGPTEVAGFERQRQGWLAEAPGETYGPRHAGVDLSADPQAGDAERLDDRPGGLAARNDEPTGPLCGKARPALGEGRL